MNRYVFSRFTDADFESILEYLDSLPAKPALRIARAIQKTLNLIGQYPYQGQAHSGYTRLFGQEVRSRLSGSYRIYYRLDKAFPEIIAILHTAREQSAILSQRTT